MFRCQLVQSMMHALVCYRHERTKITQYVINYCSSWHVRASLWTGGVMFDSSCRAVNVSVSDTKDECEAAV